MKNRVAVIAAHPDDELLGVGGTLVKHQKNGDQLYILLLSDGESSRDKSINIQKRASQAKKVAQLLKVKAFQHEKLPDNQFDTIALLKITKIIEKFAVTHKPNIIYTHHIHDLNIDHRLTCQAVMTVCRPQPHFFVKKISCFETLSSTEWQVAKNEYTFTPNEYNVITDELKQKIELLKIYNDELRPFPHPRSIEGIKIQAQKRGMEIGYKCAEAFEVIRNVLA